jgi:PAS domain-containing protein
MDSQHPFLSETAGRAELDVALLASLVYASPAVMYSCRVALDCGTVAVTGNVARVLGFTPQEFISDPSLWALRIHPDDSARVFEEMLPLFHDGEQVSEYRFQRADGRYIWLRDHMRLERDARGNPASILGCWLEIPDPGNAIKAEIVGEKTNTDTVTTAGGGRYAKQT